MKFKFYINNGLHFVGQLECDRCIGVNKNGSRCKRRVCIGTFYCFTHLQSEKHLKIKTSNIEGAGKGLFAFSKTDDELLFRKDETIIKYVGELIHADELVHRYADKTGSYALKIKENDYEDSALIRGVGSIANTAPHLCDNNTRLAVCYRKPQYAMLKATKNIYNGDEILCDYGPYYTLHENGVYFTTK
jgi:hypothetical protein